MLLPLPEPVSHTVRAIWSGHHPIQGDSRQRRGLRAGAGRPLARGSPSVTPLRVSGRSTASGSSPCCVKCRACPRFAGRCWSAEAEGPAPRRRSRARRVPRLDGAEPGWAAPRSIAAAASSIWRTSAWRGVRSPRAAVRRCCWTQWSAPAARATRASSSPRRAAGRLLTSSARDCVSPSERRSSTSCSSAWASSARNSKSGLRCPVIDSTRSVRCSAASRSRRSSARPDSAQMVDGEEMPAESQTLRIGVGGPGQIGGLGQVSGLEQGQRPRTWHHHELDRFGDVGCRQSRGGLALGGREVAQAGIHAGEDQRDGDVPFVGEVRQVLSSPRGHGLLHGRFQLPGHPVAERLKRRQPGGQLRTGRNPSGLLKQVKVLAAASRITRQQQVGGQAQQPFPGSLPASMGQPWSAPVAPVPPGRAGSQARPGPV